jgi:uncharacterized protein
MSESRLESPFPMFPLGSVLFPHVGLPLRVFEPRYRQLVLDCLDGNNSFGVVLIERGSEVGGGDSRFSIGTAARIFDAEPLDDGTWAVTAIGTDRFRVTEWIHDDPYPRAYVEMLEEIPPIAWEIQAIYRVIERLRVTLTKCVEANVPAMSPDIELNHDPSIALWQACAVAPIGPLDELALLGSMTISDRVSLLQRSLEDHDELLSPRL